MGTLWHEMWCSEWLQDAAHFPSSREDRGGKPGLAFLPASSPTHIWTEFVLLLGSLATRFQFRN